MRKFGWTDVEVPVIGQGTWMIEGDGQDRRQAIKTLELGLDIGLTHIDTPRCMAAEKQRKS